MHLTSFIILSGDLGVIRFCKCIFIQACTLTRQSTDIDIIPFVLHFYLDFVFKTSNYHFYKVAEVFFVFCFFTSHRTDRTQTSKR